LTSAWSADSDVADAPAVVQPAVASDSRALRFLIVGAVIAAYIVLGIVLRLNTYEYQLLGVPILVAFQLGIQRQPFRALWVRSAPPLRLDARFVVLWVVVGLVPAYDAVSALGQRDAVSAAFYATAIAGAFGLAYALRAMRVQTVWQLVLCVLTVSAIGILPSTLSLLLPHLIHLHIASANAAAGATTAQRLRGGAGAFLLLPVGFMVEEVFFRGALDTYLHRGERGTGWLSAIYVSALWGLWHLPGQSLAFGHLLSTVVGLLVAQIAIGVPLSLWWRKSGNLTVPDTAHALLEVARAIIGGG